MLWGLPNSTDFKSYFLRAYCLNGMDIGRRYSSRFPPNEQFFMHVNPFPPLITFLLTLHLALAKSLWTVDQKIHLDLHRQIWLDIPYFSYWEIYLSHAYVFLFCTIDIIHKISQSLIWDQAAGCEKWKAGFWLFITKFFIFSLSSFLIPSKTLI